MKKLTHIIFILLLIASIARVLFTLYLYRRLFTTPYRHSQMSFIYANSQYIKGPLAKLDISDEGLYAFAGYNYLMERGDVSGVNFENPSLGKYLIGLSILIFHNEYVISLIYGLLFIIITYKLAENVFNRTTAILSIFLISFSPIYLDQIKSSLIDLPSSLFFISAIYFYLKSRKNQKLIFLSTFLFSLSFIAKFFPSLMIVMVILLFSSFFQGKKYFYKYLVSLLIFPVVYLLSYTSYFIYHPSLIGFLKFQYWMLKWRSGNPYVVGNIARLIFTGQYKSWWDSNLSIKYSEWNIFTLVIPVGFFTSALLKFKDKNAPLLFIVGFAYFVYVFFGTTGVEKYLLPTYPIYAIFCAHLIYTVVKLLSKRFIHSRNV